MQLLIKQADYTHGVIGKIEFQNLLLFFISINLKKIIK